MSEGRGRERASALMGRPGLLATGHWLLARKRHGEDAIDYARIQHLFGFSCSYLSNNTPILDFYFLRLASCQLTSGQLASARPRAQMGIFMIS